MASASTQRERDNGLVVEAAGTAHAANLAEAVEPRDGRATCVRTYQATFFADASVAHHRPPTSAIEHEEPERRTVGQRAHRLGTRNVGGGQRRVDVTLCQPQRRTARHRSGAPQPARVGVRAQHMANGHIAPTRHRKRSGQRESHEVARARLDARRCVMSIQVDIEGRLVIEHVKVVAAAGGHHEWLTLRLPSVADRKAERRITADACGDGSVLQDLAVEDLPGRHHLHVVTGAATDERDARTEDAVRAADHLLLVTEKRVSQNHNSIVWPVRQREQRRSDVLADLAGSLGHPAGAAGRHAEIAAQRDHENPGAEYRPGTDLPGGSAANQGYIRGDLLDAVEQLAQVIAKRREDEQELRIRAGHGRASRLDACDAVRWIPGVSGTHLAGCRGRARLPDDRAKVFGSSHAFNDLHRWERCGAVPLDCPDGSGRACDSAGHRLTSAIRIPYPSRCGQNMAKRIYLVSWVFDVFQALSK